MKLFVSWSGERSKALAAALHEWIPLVLHYVEPWLSQADIEAGQRWAEQVAKELEATNFGIICITRENLNTPWVLFEAGALAKSIQGSRVIPLLLDLEFRDVAGPLAQFQAKKVDLAGVTDIVQSLNQCAPHPVPDDRVKQLFDALWPEFEKKLAAIPKATAAPKHARPQPEVLEELVASVRSLDARMRDGLDDHPRVRRRMRRIHPMMMRDLTRVVSVRAGDPVALLMTASIFREDMPWLYELGMEAYRAAKDGSPEEAMLSRRRFQTAVDFLRHSGFPAEELGLDPHTLHVLLRELDHSLDARADVATPETVTTKNPAAAPPKAASPRAKRKASK